MDIISFDRKTIARRAMYRAIRSMDLINFGLKKIARRAMNPAMLGMLDYYRQPRRRAAWGGPFNGQFYRRGIFDGLMGCLKPTVIIETGTYLGTTTAALAETGLPVYTIELHERNLGFARARLWRKRNVNLRLGDSREELLTLFSGPLADVRHKTVFAYLDAHGDADLPLLEELETIFQYCPAAVVMVDDFEVADDPGYAFDEYGPGIALTQAYVTPVIQKHALSAFYPAASSGVETGSRRGCAVFVQNAIHGDALRICSLLRAIPGT